MSADRTRIWLVCSGRPTYTSIKTATPSSRQTGRSPGSAANALAGDATLTAYVVAGSAPRVVTGTKTKVSNTFTEAVTIVPCGVTCATTAG